MISTLKALSQTGFIFAIAVAPVLIQVIFLNLCRDRSNRYYD